MLANIDQTSSRRRAFSTCILILFDVCSMFARSCKRGIRKQQLCKCSFPSAVGPSADVPSTAVDAEAAEARTAGLRLHRSGDTAWNVQDSDSRLWRVFAGTSCLQRLQRRQVASPGWLQPGRLHATHWSRTYCTAIKLSLIGPWRRHSSSLLFSSEPALSRHRRQSKLYPYDELPVIHFHSKKTFGVKRG